MLQRKDNAAGCTPAELEARGKAELAVNRRAWELRSDRRSGWRALSLRSQALGNGWQVIW